eukprot:5752472-Alexandrium_andersonii.AAC.1
MARIRSREGCSRAWGTRLTSVGGPTHGPGHCASGCHPHACNRVTIVYAITQLVAVVWGLARSMP